MIREGDILHWAAKRKIIQGSTPTQQILKIIEEVKELYGALAVMDDADPDADPEEFPSTEGVADAIGDTIVTLTIIAHMCGLTIDKCVQCAGLFDKETERQQDDT